MTHDTFDAFVRRTYGDYNKPHETEWVIDCPKCGAIKRCSLNPEKAVFNCYRCGGGGLLKFLMDAGLPQGQAYLLIHGEETLDVSDFDSITVESFQTANEPYDVSQHLKEFIDLSTPGVNFVTQSYLAGRGFTLEYAMQWGVCYANTGQFQGRLIIPVYEGRSLVYFQARSLGDAEPKYLNPKAPKGRFVFNGDAGKNHAQRGEAVVICEGAFDAMSVGSNAVAVYGKEVSAVQQTKLADICTGASAIVVAFDKGAERQANKVASNLSMTAPVSVVLMPDDRDLNDLFVEGGVGAVHRMMTDHSTMPDVFAV